MPSIAVKKETTFYPGLNIVRGGLILLVVLSHSLPPGMVVFVLYSFHMPLFLAISGFLLNKNFLKAASLSELFTKYFFRMILPWSIAYLIYEVWLFVSTGQIIPLPQALLHPYYHLWFVPALFLMVVIVKLIEHSFLAKSELINLAFVAFLCFIWYIKFKDIPLPEKADSDFYFFGDKRLYGYFFFFYLGYLIRNKRVNFNNNFYILAGITALAFLGLVAGVYLKLSLEQSFLPYILFNISLILFVLKCIAGKSFMTSKFISFCNKQSLGVYLYHYLVLQVLFTFVQPTSLVNGILLFLGSSAITLSVIYIFTLNPFLNKFILGNTKL